MRMLRTARLAGAALAAAALLPAAPALGAVHTVSPGETLWGIAQASGLSASAVAAATLHLPGAGGAGASAAPAATTSAAPAPMGAYEVRPGDTLSALAARSRVPMAQMAFMNGLDPAKPLLAGTVIKLPTGSPVVASSPGPQRTIVPAAPPAASPGRLSSGQVGSIAAQQGAPGSLAAAIAWQESGNNN